MDKILNLKRKYIGYDGEQYVNMCIPVINLNDMKGNHTEVLNQDENGRLDRVIWRSVDKNMDMIDLVMYANHIFNPFAVKDGDMLYMPLDDDKIYVDSGEPSLPDGTKHSNNIKGEKVKTYAEKVEYLAKKGLGIK